VRGHEHKREREWEGEREKEKERERERERSILYKKIFLNLLLLIMFFTCYNLLKAKEV